MAFVDLCRLCGTDTLNIVRNSIFEGEGRVKKYALKISECLTLQVTEKDELPKIMCGECSFKLESLSDFRERAYKTETDLHSKSDSNKVKTKLVEDGFRFILDQNDDKIYDVCYVSNPEPEAELEDEENPVKEIPVTKQSTRKSEELSDVEDGPDLNSDNFSSFDDHLSSPESEPELQINKENPTEKRPATEHSLRESAEELPDIGGSPYLDSSDDGSDNFDSSSPKPEPELEIRVEVPQNRKQATKRSLRESESEEKEETPAKKRPRKPKSPPATATPVAAPPLENAGNDWKPDDARNCQVCRKHFSSEAELQQHLLICINTGRKLKLKLQRLTKDQVQDLEGPRKLNSSCPESHESQIYNNDEHLKNAEFLKSDTDLHSTKVPGKSKTAIKISVKFRVSKQKQSLASHFLCDVCDKTFSCKAKLQLHIERHTQLRPIACDVPGCSYVAKNPYNSQQHMTIFHNSMPYLCLMCGKKIKMYQSFVLHVAKHKTKTPGVIKCLHRSCNKLFQSAHELKNHFKEAHEDVKQFECNECGNFFASKEKLKVHLFVHWDERPFKCDFKGCSYSAKKSDYVHEHKKQVHTLNLFTCCHCGKTLKGPVTFKKHQERHQIDKRDVFKCPRSGCSKSFTTQFDLREHVDAHDGVQRFTCHECGNLLTSKVKLKQHVMQHIHVVIACDVSDCSFASKSKCDLRLHRKTVHLIWPLNCQLCGQGFEHSSVLKKHLKFHQTGEPGVIKCSRNWCKQTFTCSTDLKKHIGKHSLRERPFQCAFPGCNYGADTEKQLSVHERGVHSPSVVSCHLCNKSLKYMHNIAQHIKTVHKKL